MKIRYIEPKPRGATIYEIANLPKLGLPLLAACIAERDPDVDQWIYCELINGVRVDWDDVESADLVCISTTTNTTLEGYAYSERLRAKGIPVVVGGSHVTFMAHEALKHLLGLLEPGLGRADARQDQGGGRCRPESGKRAMLHGESLPWRRALGACCCWAPANLISAGCSSAGGMTPAHCNGA